MDNILTMCLETFSLNSEEKLFKRPLPLAKWIRCTCIATAKNGWLTQGGRRGG